MPKIKLTDPAATVADVKDKDGKPDKAKTDKAKGDARKNAPGWKRNTSKAQRDSDRTDRIDTARAVHNMPKGKGKN